MKIKNFIEFLNELYIKVPEVQNQISIQPIQVQNIQNTPINLNPNKVIKKIDFSFLNKDSNIDNIKQICDSLKISSNQKYIYSVIVYPEFITETKKYLEDTDIKVSTVISFPDGSNKQSENLKQIQSAISDDVDQINVVMNYQKLLSGENYENIQKEIRSYVEYCKERSITIGVIIEMESLGDISYISKSTEICKNANVDFIITSTGMNKDTTYTFEQKINDITKIIIPMIQGMDDININISGGINSTDKIMKCLFDGKIQRITTTITPQTLMNKEVPPKYKPEPQDELIVQQA